MKKDRQSKIVAILALCISVVAITLGFAAFSNTLTISSGATVSPNSSDFKIRAYGILFDSAETSDMFDINSYTSTEKSIPLVSGGGPYAEITDAFISADGLHIYNMSVTFDRTGQGGGYMFGIKNEGKYDAYLDLERYFKIMSGEEKIGMVCKAGEGTSQELVDQACENINYNLNFIDSQGYYLSPDDNPNNYYLIPAGEHLFLDVWFGYELGNGVLADGDFDVEIEDVTFEFSTVAPEK